MALLKLAVASVVAYGLYRYINRDRELHRAAFAAGKSMPDTAEVRNAGPESMRIDPPEWDRVDEASNESYPASDPPAASPFN
jgi:hypothetical protein